MIQSKLRICLLLEGIFSYDMPARPAITEIFAHIFPANGHKIVWISNILNTDNKIQISSYHDVMIVGIPLKEKKRIPIIFTAGLRYLRKFIFLNHFLRKDSYSIIQIRNNLVDGMLAIYYKKMFNVKFVFQYSFPKRFDVPENARMKSVLFVINWLNKAQLNLILNNSDLILPISTWMKDDLLRRGIPESKIFPLPMGVNPDTFSAEIQDIELREKFVKGTSTLILYQGSLSKLRRLEIMLRAIEKVKHTKPDIKLLIVGDGDGRKDLENICTQLGIINEVIFTGTVPYSEMPRYISIADICLCPVPPDPIFMVSSPTKMFEYMVMKKPIIANSEIPEQCEVFKSSKCGLLVNFSSDSFAAGILYLMTHTLEAQSMGQNGYRWVIDNRTYKMLADSLEKRYYKLLETN
jgi:glycosyltransferase involved in cell wall biosynthesis